MNFQIRTYQPEYKNEVVSVWEKSVLSTHHFLQPNDFIEIRKMLQDFDFETLDTFCLIDNNRVVGFIAVKDFKIEMLFLHDAYIGKGLGRKLMNFVLSNFQIHFVDVNEQNKEAQVFYEKFGFEVYERTEKDDLGKDYPLLRMRKKQNENTAEIRATC